MKDFKVEYNAQTRTFVVIGEEFNIVLTADVVRELAIQLFVDDLDKGKRDDGYAQFLADARDLAGTALN